MNQQPPRSIALHIGAHKTATSHLQRSFAVQQQALNNVGVRYYGPDTLRKPRHTLIDLFDLKLGDTLPKPTRTRAAQLDHMFQDGHRLVLSDENFIGVMHRPDGNMRSPLYRGAEERVTAFVEAVAPYPVDLFIGIRNPAGFLASAYGQALMGQSPILFADYLAKNPMALVQWAGLIAGLRQIPNVGRIVVWKQEDYRWRFYKATGAMMGEHAHIRIMPFPKKVHVGLSQRAVEHVLMHAGGPIASGLGDVARRAFPVSAQNPAFHPFSAQEIEMADAIYALQLSEIAAMDGVTILRA